MSKNENLIRNFDQVTLEKAQNRYLLKSRCSIDHNNNRLVSKLDQDGESTKWNGIQIDHEPFTHCILSNVVTDSNFINELTAECNSKLKYIRKNNDLYKFRQTKDLGNVKSSYIKQFRDEILYGSIRQLIENVTGIELSSKIDVTSSKYEHTDYLLCHDDDIHDDQMENGRRIAFIYYLVPPGWEKNDGGNLDLFKVNENLQPTEIHTSIGPKFNSLLFFEVSDRSFHQVAEVLSKTKCRLSINGWFHSKINIRPQPCVDLIPDPIKLNDIDANLFFDWVIEKYLKPQNQTEIQLKFMSSSEIKLDKVFHENKYQEISEALKLDSIAWKPKGPANRRKYEVADMNSVPEIITELVKVLTSDFMGLTLSNMTGLALHWSMKKSKEPEYDEEDDDDDYSDDYSDELTEDEEEDNEPVEDSNEEETEEENKEKTDATEILKRKNTFNMMNNNKKEKKLINDKVQSTTNDIK